MDDLGLMSQRRKRAHARLTALRSPVYRSFLELERAAYRDGALSARVKLLAGFAVSMVVDCGACVQWHVDEAARAGAGEAEMLEMIEVAVKMGGAPAVVAARVAIEAMDRVCGERKSPGPGGGKGSRAPANRKGRAS